MPKYPFPSSHDPKKHEPSSGPKFIIFKNQREAHTRKDEEPKQEPAFQETPFRAFEQLKEARFPFFLRILFFFASLLCLLWSYGALLCTLGLGIVHLITFFYFSELGTYVSLYWNMTKKAMVYFIGLLLAMFSPLLGISLILIYPFLRGEKIELATILSRFHKS